MQSLQYYQPFGLLVVRYREPFSVEDLFASARSADAPGQSGSRHRCALVDLREVSLGVVSSDVSRRFASIRRERIGDGPSEPVAFLIGRPEDYGVMRMNNQWLEAIGLRAERDTVITESLLEALNWLGDQTAQPALAEEMMVHFDIEERLRQDKSLGKGT